MPYYSELGIYTPSSSYTSPLLKGPYSGHSSIIASNILPPSSKQFSRGNFRGFRPHLTTISESNISAPIRRVNSPKVIYHTSPRVRVPRPVKINTSDIDVSLNRYNNKYAQAKKPQTNSVEEDKKEPSPVVEKEAKPNSEIRRDRPTVRLQTIHKDTLEKEIGQIKSWRDNFQPEELVGEAKRRKKSPGEILKEKFLIRSRSKDNLPLLESPKLTRKSSLKKSPSFKDICDEITSDQAVEDLNPGQPFEIRRRQSRQISQEDIIKEIHRSSSTLSVEEVQILDALLQAENEVGLYDTPPVIEDEPKAARKRKAAKKKTAEKLDAQEQAPQSKLRKDSSLKNMVKDISQVEIEMIPMKQKHVITGSVGDIEEKTNNNLKAVVGDLEIQEKPHEKKPEKKFRFNVSVQEFPVKKTITAPKYQLNPNNYGATQVPKPQVAVTTSILKKRFEKQLGHVSEPRQVKAKPILTKSRSEIQVRQIEDKKVQKSESIDNVHSDFTVRVNKAQSDESLGHNAHVSGKLRIVAINKTGTDIPKADDLLKTTKKDLKQGTFLCKFKQGEAANKTIDDAEKASQSKSDIKTGDILDGASEKVSEVQSRAAKHDIKQDVEKGDAGSVLKVTSNFVNHDNKENVKKVEDLPTKIGINATKLPQVKSDIANHDNKDKEVAKKIEDLPRKIDIDATKVSQAKSDADNKEALPSKIEIDAESFSYVTLDAVKNDIEGGARKLDCLSKTNDIDQDTSSVLSAADAKVTAKKSEVVPKNDEKPRKDLETCPSNTKGNKIEPETTDTNKQTKNKASNVDQVKSSMFSGADAKMTAKKSEVVPKNDEKPKNALEICPTNTKDNKIEPKTSDTKKRANNKSNEENNFWDANGEETYEPPKLSKLKLEQKDALSLLKDIQDSTPKVAEDVATPETPEERERRIISKRSLIQKANKSDPDLRVFEPPTPPPPEPVKEPSPEPSFVPLQSNRLSQWMHPWKKPEQMDECPIEIYAKPKFIRARHIPRRWQQQQQTVDSESEDSTTSEEDSSSEDESVEEEEETGAEAKLGASASSSDSGFDSGRAKDNECDVNCHKKCEKLMAHLCGINQKLVVDAIEKVRKGSIDSRDSGNALIPASNPAFALDDLPEEVCQSSTYQSFQKSGRITPPATTIPRFKKYCVDDFNFLKVLGKGSFGKVLLAELKGTEYYYAIKCLKKDVVLEDDDVECTLIERKVLALGTKHPYLCHLLCTFQTESHLFFVMEYLNGGDLMFHIQAERRFSEARARFYGAEIISGLRFLHNKGIVYRDLKLDNILLDFDGHVRIADFGMCKLQIFLDRMADTFCGTPDYMAPEIIKGQHYNQCVDWWSFGVLLYEMLLGQSPFSGSDEDELFWSICNEKPVIPRFLSAEAGSVLVQFLEKDANKRLGNRFSPHGDIQDHAFFTPIDWVALEARRLEPPFKPNLQHPLDTQYFDKTFTAEKAKLTPIETGILQSMDQTQFQGFSYTNPNATDK